MTVEEIFITLIKEAPTIGMLMFVLYRLEPAIKALTISTVKMRKAVEFLTYQELGTRPPPDDDDEGN